MHGKNVCFVILSHEAHLIAFLFQLKVGPSPFFLAVFSFLYLKKIKISKLYVRFGKFQKYTPVTLWGATGLKCNFFLLQIYNKVPREKKEGACRPRNGRQDPVAHPRGDRGLSPVGGATGALPPI